jgi:hypothetical protein
MKQIVEFQSETTDKPILIEIASDEEFGFEEASGLGEKIKKGATSIEEAFSHLKPIAEALLKKMDGISQKPDEISIAFGLKLNAQAGVVVSSSSIEANFKVTMTWKNETRKSTKN